MPLPSLLSSWPLLASLALVSLTTLAFFVNSSRAPKRKAVLPRTEERVLLLGCSSGIGKELALMYAARGASVCLVARRADALAAVVKLCKAFLLDSPIPSSLSNGGQPARKRTPAEVDAKLLEVVADVTNVDDMIRLRERITSAWGGIDTVYVIAGLSATRPFLSIAGSTLSPFASSSASASHVNSFATQQVSGAEKDGIEKLVNAARQTMEVNFMGPLTSYATFLPLLSTTSPWPVMVNVSSVAASVGAPTRSLYAASKAAGLMLTGCVSLEGAVHGMGVSFVSICPGTVKTSFRARAIDASGVDDNAGWSSLTLEADDVALRSVAAVDRATAPTAGSPAHDIVFLPRWPYAAAHVVQHLPFLGALVRKGAISKYTKKGKAD